MVRNKMINMKKITNILSAIFLLIGAASCSSEAPFSEGEQIGEGRLLSSALSVELKTDEKLVRATPVPDVNDFTVDFLKADDLSQSVKSFEYGSMPEVVTLPVGDYIVKAYYGGDYGEGNNAAFDKPYYLGQSERFSIEKDKIKDNIGTIECKLSNVKVTILFDESLANVMSDNSKVSVTVGSSGSLDFDKYESRSGFFAYDEGSTTLAAVFSGVVDGDSTSETKTYDTVQPGVHYRITFKLHAADPNDPGDINPGDPGNEIKIDAGIQLEDQTGGSGVDVGVGDDEDIYMKDDRYPEEEDPEPDPGPDEPTPDEPGNGPTVTAEDPINLEEWNLVPKEIDEEHPYNCVLNVHSDTGVTGFTVEIDSPKLTNDVLTGVGLSSKFDLISCLTAEGVDVEEGLIGLSLPVKDQVKGQNDVRFDVSQFMSLLGIYGAADHKFILTIIDAGGKTVTELKLRTE